MASLEFSTEPLITTVIPTFRRPQMLRRAIKSALDQQGVALKVCVYDNASGDETADVVRALAAEDSRLMYRCHPENIGSFANFDGGMRAVETPFFSILSDDDYLLPGFYQRALASLAAHPEAMCWMGLTLNVDETGVVWDARVNNWPREGLYSPPEGFIRLTGGMAPAWTSILFRRSVIDRVGLIDQGMAGPGDLEYCLRLAARFPYLLDKHPSAVFTLNHQSFSATQPMSSFWPGWKNMLKSFESDPELAMGAAALTALRHDAERMLFRRGASALAAPRFDFVQDAATALSQDCGAAFRAYILRFLAKLCSSNNVLQQGYARAYRLAERRIIKSRGDLQSSYAHLLRSL